MATGLRRFARYGVRVALAVAGVAGLAAVALLIRLSYAPLDLPFLTRRIETALTGGPDAPRISIAATTLALSFERRRIELTVKDVVIDNPDGSPLLSLEAIALRPSIYSLLSGEPRIAVAELLAPTLHLTRQADGSIALTAAAPKGTPAGGLSAAAIMRDPQPLPPALRMSRFAIRDAVVWLTDAASGKTWSAQHVELAVKRTGAGAGAGADAELRGELAAGKSRTLLSATVHYQGTSPALTVHAELSGLVPADWKELAGPLANLNLPLSAQIDTTFDADLRPQLARVQIQGDPGSIVLPADLPVLSIQRAEIQMTADPQAGRLQVERGVVVTGDGVEMNVAGSFAYAPDTMQLVLDAAASKVTTKLLLAHWPSSAAAAARQWVSENIKGGALSTVRARFGGRVDDQQALTVQQLSGTFDFDGLAVRFLDTMPSVEQVSGNASFNNAGLRFQVNGGTLSSLQLSSAAVRIDGLDVDQPRLSVEAKVGGSLPSAISLLNREPIRLSMKSDDFGGTFAARIALGFALGRVVTLPSMGLDVQAELKDVRVQETTPWEVTQGALDLSIRDLVLHVEGAARVAGAPVRLRISNTLGKPETHSVDVAATIDRAQRSALGFDPGSWLDGPIGLTAQVRIDDQGDEIIQLELDLKQATIDAGSSALGKPAGQPGQAQARLRLSDGQLSRIDAFEFSSATTKLTGSAQRSTGRWQAVDLQGWLNGTQNRQAGRATLALRRSGQRYQVQLDTDDVSALWPSLDEGKLRGGSGSFAASMEIDHLPLRVDGHLGVRDLTVIGAPVLARLIRFTSLRGMYDTLLEKGLLFEKLEADLIYSEELLTLSNGLATSSGMLLRFAGPVDFGTRQVELAGTLVPSYYGINQAPAKLPWVGGLMEKVTGEAIQSFDFRVHGPMAQPEVTVNSSSVAPGVLKELLRTLER